jgi:two-component system LytT family response regulator
MNVRSLIIDDEAVARTMLRDLLSSLDWVAVEGEASDGPSAVEAIDRLRPDLIFLDVRLPKFSGLAVLDRIQHSPAVVFTTAFDQYAITALRAGALDYLLKPFGKKQFLTAMARVRERINTHKAQPPLFERAREVWNPSAALRRLFVRSEGRIVPVPLQSIRHIEACDDYVKLHASGASFVAELPMISLEKRLDSRHFIRVHRSHIVNVDFIASLQHHDNRRLIVFLKGGEHIVASRAGTRALRDLVL